MKLRVGSLFSGIGGIDLGLERAGMTIVFQVENEAYCTRVLAKHWPDVPRFGDIRDVDPALLPACDILAGGFPCQDISNAGQRAGIDGTRSGLWSEYVRLIRALRPRYVLVENVAALLNRGMGRVLCDLAGCGYDAEWSVLSACALGAPHTRERLFILAYPAGGWPGQLRGPQRPDSGEATGRLYWSAPEPPVARVVNGVPYRVERLTGLGNAVVPQVAEYLGLLIAAHANDLAVPA